MKKIIIMISVFLLAVLVLFVAFPGCSKKGNGKVGFIDKKGNFVIEPQYDWVTGFKGGVAAVLVRTVHKSEDGANISLSGKMGAINIKGEFIVPLEFTTTRAIGDGLIMAQDRNNKWTLYNSSGKNICSKTFTSQFGEASEGLIWYTDAVNSDTFEEGFVDRDCNKVLKFFLTKSSTKNSVLPESAKFGNGLIWGSANGEPVLINKKGDIMAWPGRVNKEKFYGVRPFSEGFSAVATGFKKVGDDPFVRTSWGFVDINGKMVISPDYDDAHDFSEGLACVKKNNLYGFVDAGGREVIGLQFDDVDIAGFKDGLCVVVKEKKYRFIDRGGKEVFGREFEEAYGFSEGLAAVKVNGKWGFIDRAGKFVIKPSFEKVASFADSVAAAVK